MRKLKRDRFGVPILKQVDIEEHAESFLKYFDDSCLREPKYTPIAGIAANLQANHGVRFDFKTDLGYSPAGAKFLGRFILSSNTICVDPSIMDPDPRFPFTLAHEMGHFVFHREVDVAALRAESSDSIDDTESELAIHRVSLERPMDWVEWQANTFAAALLVPRRTAEEALISVQRSMGISRRLGKVYLTDARENADDHRGVVESLARLYQTSKQVMKIRLRELNLVIEGRKGGLRSIEEIMPGVITDLLGGSDDT